MVLDEELEEELEPEEELFDDPDELELLLDDDDELFFAVSPVPFEFTPEVTIYFDKSLLLLIAVPLIRIKPFVRRLSTSSHSSCNVCVITCPNELLPV